MDKNGFREGAKAALPIVLGYLPVGMTFGILARKAGLTSFEVGLMSLFVYAGASQFLAIEMISKGRPSFSVILATFFADGSEVEIQPQYLLAPLPVFLFAWKVKNLGDLSFWGWRFTGC